MPLTLKQLRAKSTSVEVEVLGETVHLGFAPGRYTSDVDERMADFFDSVDPDATRLTADQNAVLLDFLLAILVDWDVLDDDGKPIPIDAENLRLIPPMVRLEFVAALGKANAPDPQQAPTSEEP